MRDRECQHTDGELIDLIYAALLGEASWQHFLDRLSNNAPDGRTILFSHNMSQSDEYLAMASRFEGPELDAYASHYVNTNPWLQYCALRQVGLGVHSDEIIPHEEMIRTEFYNDFLVPNGIARSIGVTMDKSGDCPLIISTVTSRADPEANSRFSDQLTRIAPHLRRAARFYRNSSAKWGGFELGISLFDSMDVGVVVVGEDRRIKTISQTGQDVLNAGTAMSISPLGQLRLGSEDAQAVLLAMLKRTYAGQKAVSVYVDDTQITLVAVEKDRISLYFEGPTVAILLQKPGYGNRAVDLKRLATIYNLTKSEIRALSGIIAGKTVNQIAEDAALSRETVRSQLKSLCAKTGTGGQKDLLRLVHRFNVGES